MGSVTAQLLVLRKRASTWTLMGIWMTLGIMFAYLLPYLTYRNAPNRRALELLVPEGLADNLVAGFPFFGGVFALMLGVLAVGSDYGWDTYKTMLTQRPGRIRLLGAKVVALGVTLVPFVALLFVLGAGASYAIARAEGVSALWPSLADLAAAFGAGWYVLATWASLGVLLAVLARGTALATGIGILYAFVIEGILSAVAGQVSWLDPIVEFFLRANAYSLVVALGVPAGSFADNGPGGFLGPFVDGGQAALTLATYAVAALVLAGLVFQRRDVGDGTGG